MNKKSDRENCHYSSYSIAAKKFNFGLFMMHTNNTLVTDWQTEALTLSHLEQLIIANN